jgi:hypothetical protein
MTTAQGSARPLGIGLFEACPVFRRAGAWLPRSVEDLDATAVRTGGVNSLGLVIALAALAAGCGGEDRERNNGEGGGHEAVRVSAGELLSRDPYMGVSCKIPNSFGCDRVGLAVWLREPATRVEAAIAGSELELDDPDWSGPAEDGQRRMFAGFLQPAGLIDGSLQITSDDGPERWVGTPPVYANVDLRIVHDDGSTTTTTLKVGLSPGWG